MKTSRYSDSQIISILKQAETGTQVPEQRLLLSVACKIRRYGRLVDEPNERTGS